MTDGSASGSNSRSSQFGGNVPRRLSYASVASGATAQAHPARSGAFSHLVSTIPSDLSPPMYQREQQYQRRHSEQDQDSLGVHHWRKPTPLPSYSRKFANNPNLGMNAMSPNPFFIPSYLRHSRYMAKLEAAHKARVKKEREQPAGGPSALNSFSTSAGSTRLAPSHRGMTYDIIESNPPKEEDVLPSLPSRWSEQDKYPGLDVIDGQDLKYSGAPSKADIEAASVRTDHPMPPACGIYYFEVEIKQKTKDTPISIGFSTSEASLERLPGWETNSWGYHGDDGKLFFGDHAGRSYGPIFGAGDVIGCGINFNTCQAFFTKNGQDLGICFPELKKDVKLYPSIGVKKQPGALLAANFGQRPFVFDIEDRVLSEQVKVSREIAKAKVTSLRPQRDENTLIQELVAQFLAHDGYVETAKAFAEEMRREKQSLNNALPPTTSTARERDDTDAVHRQRIRRAIFSGDIDQALEITHAQFPVVLADNPDIEFRLKCRKWIELIGKSTELDTPTHPSGHERKASNRLETNSGVDDDFAQDMELDEQPNGDSRANGEGKSRADDGALQHVQRLNEAMLYGQELHREFRDEDGDWAKALRDISSLVAYNDPRGSVNGHLLDPAGRVTVAEELNSAILVSLGRSPSAALETAWKQTEALIDVLSEEGGPAAFVNLQATFSS
ncbi:hypothetical protein AYL99_00492 [Fonsecaea erecta]|uniref:Protein FYV10 n=1 Tax=Fonsecaea erecta TaxID=1367422 RepID=A0A178ZXG1_9EURO|nr:hypothetical protein AYL99_00492 [Fonsecaea erecta]OAP64520.1 hypothetical protein AYL99_00492 [Fonsecaea erecta]